MTLYLAYLRDWWRRVRELLRRPRTRRGPRCPAPGLAWDAQATGLQHPPTGELAPEVLVFDDLPFWEVATYTSECLVHPIGPPFPRPAREVVWRWAAALGLVVIAVLPGCGGEDFDPDTDPKNPNCGETSEECT